MKKRENCPYQVVPEGNKRGTSCHRTRAAAVKAGRYAVLRSPKLKKAYIWDHKQGFPRRITCGVVVRGGPRVKGRVKCGGPDLFKRKARG